MMIFLFPVENDRNTGREALVRNCVLACLSTPKRKIINRSVNSCVIFPKLQCKHICGFPFFKLQRKLWLYGFLKCISLKSINKKPVYKQYFPFLKCFFAQCLSVDGVFYLHMWRSEAKLGYWALSFYSITASVFNHLDQQEVLLSSPPTCMQDCWYTGVGPSIWLLMSCAGLDEKALPQAHVFECVFPHWW